MANCFEQVASVNASSREMPCPEALLAVARCQLWHTATLALAQQIFQSLAPRHSHFIFFLPGIFPISALFYRISMQQCC
jgi:hypothetical protein